MAKSVAKHKSSTSSSLATLIKLDQEEFLNWFSVKWRNTISNLLKAEVTADTQIDLGNAVYYSTESESALSSLLDWRVTSCTAAEEVTVTDDDITTGGRTFDLIKVG